MEGDRVRFLTTRAVLAALGVSLLALIGGLALLAVRHTHLTAGVKLRPLPALPGELVALQPDAWLSLGVMGLLATTLVRLVGMALELWSRDQRRPAAAAALVALLLVGAMARGLL